MAIKEYEVVLRIRVEKEDPNDWSWNELLFIGPKESLELKSCTCIQELHLTKPTISSETKDWLPEFDYEDTMPEAEDEWLKAERREVELLTKY